MAEIRKAGANLNHGVRVTKHDHGETIQTFFHVPMNTRQCSRIYEPIMDLDIKLPPPPCENNTTTLNKPNKHLERFKALNNTAAKKSVSNHDEETHKLVLYFPRP